MNASDFFLLRAATVLLCTLWAAPASPQSAGLGCTLQPVAGTSRLVLSCPGGVRVTAEPGARYAITDRNQDGIADGVALRSKALLLEVPAGTRGGFVVVTPQAIAAVRGTTWAVDVASGRTSVFVVEGRVAVESPAAASRVVLGPGQGVDVERGTGPLEVKRWGAERAAALLARLGR